MLPPRRSKGRWANDTAQHPGCRHEGRASGPRPAPARVFRTPYRRTLPADRRQRRRHHAIHNRCVRTPATWIGGAVMSGRAILFRVTFTDKRYMRIELEASSVRRAIAKAERLYLHGPITT